MKNIGNNKLTEILKFAEPIIVSGEYFGIKLLSVYDFMLCVKMSEELTRELIIKGFDKKTSKIISEEACIVSMCLYDFNNKKIFNNGLEVLKGLTPDTFRTIYNEYIKIMQKIIKRDDTIKNILSKVKNHLTDNSEMLLKNKT